MRGHLLVDWRGLHELLQVGRRGIFVIETDHATSGVELEQRRVADCLVVADFREVLAVDGRVGVVGPLGRLGGLWKSNINNRQLPTSPQHIALDKGYKHSSYLSSELLLRHQRNVNCVYKHVKNAHINMQNVSTINSQHMNVDSRNMFAWCYQ